MNERLAEVEDRYEKLTREISDPSAFADLDQYAKLTREHSELQEVVEAFRAYRALETQAEEARALLGDPELGSLAREELAQAEVGLEETSARLKSLLLPKDPLDEKNVILEIRAGTGGEEAALFAAELFRMYSRHAERNRWQIETLSSNPTGIGGLKEIIALIKGQRVYSRLKFESGVHRVQRIPATESGGRIHTSAVTVAVLPEADEVDVAIRPEDIRLDVFRAGGAGGQHVNRTESAVRITHLPSGIVVSCQDEKSQHKNRARAMKILQSRLFEQMKGEAESERSEERRAQVGTGDRSERVRTYNFPQGRVTDHRINLTLYRLEEFLEGDLDPVVDALLADAQAQLLGQGDA
ncbi:MAG: peptide chain release factor 1 [Deltaproteobacteria bacterium]|nr:peptide chain release factor 1 [Deltaproteobacteria bacterium]